MIRSGTCIAGILSVSLLIFSPLSFAGPYHLSTDRELFCLGTGGILNLAGVVAAQSAESPSLGDLSRLDNDDIPSFDRSYAGRWDPASRMRATFSSPAVSCFLSRSCHLSAMMPRKLVSCMPKLLHWLMAAPVSRRNCRTDSDHLRMVTMHRYVIDWTERPDDLSFRLTRPESLRASFSLPRCIRITTQAPAIVRTYGAQ